MIQNEAAAEASVFTNGQLRIDYAAECAYLGDDELHPLQLLNISFCVCFQEISARF